MMGLLFGRKPKPIVLSTVTYPWPDPTNERIQHLEVEVSLANTYVRDFAAAAIEAEAERDAARFDLKKADLALERQDRLLTSRANMWKDRYNMLLERYDALGRVALADALPGRAEREDHYRSWRELSDTLDVARDTIARAHALYVRRCAETVDNASEGEEMFLAELSEALDPESDEPFASV